MRVCCCVLSKLILHFWSAFLSFSLPYSLYLSAGMRLAAVGRSGTVWWCTETRLMCAVSATDWEPLACWWTAHTERLEICQQHLMLEKSPTALHHIFLIISSTLIGFIRGPVVQIDTSVSFLLLLSFQRCSWWLLGLVGVKVWIQRVQSYPTFRRLKEALLQV